MALLINIGYFPFERNSAIHVLAIDFIFVMVLVPDYTAGYRHAGGLEMGLLC